MGGLQQARMRHGTANDAQLSQKPMAKMIRKTVDRMPAPTVLGAQTNKLGN